MKVTNASHQQRVINNLTTLMLIDNVYRGPEVLNELNHLIAATMSTNFHYLLLPIIEYYTLAATYGLRNHYPKTLISTPQKIPRTGGYFLSAQSEIHLTQNTLFILIHEIVHAVIFFIWDSGLPTNNFNQWYAATQQLIHEIPRHKPHSAYIFNSINDVGYQGLTARAGELPPIIATFILVYGRFPNTTEGFSPLLQYDLRTLFLDLIKIVKIKRDQFKRNIHRGVNKIDLFFSLNNIRSRSFHRNKKYMISDEKMGFYPLHIAAGRGDVELMLRLLRGGKTSLDDKDHFGNTPTHAAIHFNRINALELISNRFSYLSFFMPDETHLMPLQRVHPCVINMFMSSIGRIYFLLRTARDEIQLEIGTNFTIYFMQHIGSKPILTRTITNALCAIEQSNLPSASRYYQCLIYNYQNQSAFLESVPAMSL